MEQVRLDQPVRLSEQSWPENITPVVSICCITYNQEKFIRDCLEGFLMQETTFPVEILVHDDASNDKTADIIREYEARNPGLFKPIYQTENQYSKGIKPNTKFNIPRAAGQYIAFCEGDDYWIDPLKLQKQVDFLEKNVDHGLVHTEINLYREERKEMIHSFNSGLINSNTVKSKTELFDHILHARIRIRTPTVMIRKKFLDSIQPNDMSFLMGDTPRWLDLSQISLFHYFDYPTAVYRSSLNTASRQKDKKKNYRFVLSMYEMRLYYCKKYNYQISKTLIKMYNRYMITYLVYDPFYKPFFPLSNPSIVQKMMLNLIRKNLFISLLKKYVKIYEYIENKLHQKLKFNFFL
ncbi:MAG: glycosyltransferase [Smithella sp.]|nr:glycosyltransferase [Smithella sp.]